MESRAHAIVTGRVQGVCFRDFTRRWASSLSLQGWVRNMEDGRVEILAEGDEQRLRDLIARVREGPSFARVDDVEISWGPATGEFGDFRITY
jgi:acylphosphatase